MPAPRVPIVEIGSTAVAQASAKPAEDTTQSTASTRRRMLGAVGLALWVAIIVFQGTTTFRDPSGVNMMTLGVLVLLFAAVQAQILLLRWSGTRKWRTLNSRLYGSAYISESSSLPKRNYLLAELRREMPQARASGRPFVLVVISIDTITSVVERRGADFGDRAQRALADLVGRVTRKTDFVSHLASARFCVLLNECSEEQSWIYLQRVPGHIGVSDGKQMFDVPIAVRVHQYDMESIYATDVMREAEDAAALWHQDERQNWSQVA